MILYHYTANLLRPKICAKGLTKGVLPWSMHDGKPAGLVGGWQWLTQNPDYNQAWAQPMPFSNLPFRRDEWRITIDIPAEQIEHLIHWPKMRDKYHPASEVFIDSFKDSQIWYLFGGVIRPSWFVKWDRNPLRAPDISAELLAMS